MKARLMVLVAIVAAVVAAVSTPARAGTWTKQTSGTENYFTDVSFVDANNGWAVGANLTIRATTDGGANWVPETSPVYASYSGVDFVQAGGVTAGWAVGSGGTIIRKVGAGAWGVQPSPTTNELNAVSAVDPLNAWAVGTNGTIVRTNTAGTIWSPQTSGTTEQLNDVTFVDGNTGWAVGMNGTILHTANGGSTWTPQPSPVSATNISLNGIDFVSPTTGWAVGGSPSGFIKILHTTNGGAEWSLQPHSLSGFLSDVDFVDSKTGYAVYETGIISGAAHTADGGATWHVEAVDTDFALFALTFVDPVRGWIVGTKGQIYIHSNQSPVPSFTEIATGLKVSFDATASNDPDGTIASHEWDFGDGSTASGSTATHTYASEGTFVVKLTVTDTNGVTDTASKSLSVVKAPPVADFIASADKLAVTFDGSPSSDPDGTITSYAWDFGDGATASDATASHTYAKPGTYDIELTVTDDAGLTGSVTKAVTIVNEPPVAGFTNTVNGLTVNVDASGSSDPDGTIESYSWDFGDGTTGSAKTASHTYASSGTYTIALIVTDDGGLGDLATTTVKPKRGAVSRGETGSASDDDGVSGPGEDPVGDDAGNDGAPMLPMTGAGILRLLALAFVLIGTGTACVQTRKARAGVPAESA